MSMRDLPELRIGYGGLPEASAGEEDPPTVEPYGLVSADLARPDCPRCDGRGSLTVEHPGRTEYALCPCVLLTQRARAAQVRIERLLPGAAQGLTLEAFDPDGSTVNEAALHAMRNLVEHWPTVREQGWFVGLHADAGAGDRGRVARRARHLACGAAIALIRRHLAHPKVIGYPALVRGAYARVRDETAPDVMREAAEAELLVVTGLDGLVTDAQRSRRRANAPWIAEQLFLLFDHRVLHDLPVVYTSEIDLTETEWEDLPHLARVSGRLLDSTVASIPVE